MKYVNPYITSHQKSAAVAGVMPSLEMNYLTHKDLQRLAAEWFADEGISVVPKVCSEVATRCLVVWQGEKQKVRQVIEERGEV